MPSRNLRNFEFRLGRQGLIFFVFGMSLLVLFVFVFGVIVGVHIDAYPEKIAGVVPEFLRAMLHRPAEQTVFKGDEAPVPSASEEKKPPAADLYTQSSAAVGGQEKKDAPPEVAVKAVTVTAPAEEKNGPAKEAESPSPEGKRYQLQVGSFKSNGQAKKFSDQITALGYEPQIVTAEVPKQGKWFRVVINDFRSREEAKAAAGALTGKIKGLSYIIRSSK